MTFTPQAIEAMRANRAIPSPISPMPGRKTNRQLEQQGWNAAIAGFNAEDCPYYSTSTAEKYWLKGFRS